MSWFQKRIRPHWPFYAWGIITFCFCASYLIWFFWPSKPLNIIVMDKTVLTEAVPEHLSLSWLLTHEQIVKPDGSQRDPAIDYYGFKPKQDYKWLEVDFEGRPDQEIQDIVSKQDAVFYTDTYGVYSNEWYGQGSINEHSGLVYGGLKESDVKVILESYKQEKLTLLEFNLFASPTDGGIRSKVESRLGLHFTGWTGRVFENLDTTNNPDMPRWVVRMYENQYRKDYRFKGQGYVFVHEAGKILILEPEMHLTEVTPVLKTGQWAQNYFDLPAEITYGFWIDIIKPKDSTKVLAEYHFNTTEKGDSALRVNGIPKITPAMLKLQNRDHAWYFAGDWSDNPIPYPTAKFAGSQYLYFLFSPSFNKLDRRSFFWRYYRPLVTKLFKNIEPLNGQRFGKPYQLK